MRSANFKLFAILLAVSAFLVIFDRLGFLAAPKILVQFLLTPTEVQLFRAKQAVGQQFKTLGNLVSTAAKNRVLAEENARLLGQLTKLKNLEEENQALRRQLGAQIGQNHKLILAETVGLSRFLKIAAGEKLGVKVGAAVVWENALVGKVISVSGDTAQVLLPTDSDWEISAEVVRSGARPKGIVVGNLGSGVILDKILSDEPVSIGDLVVTAGGEGTPAGLLIGRVKRIEKQDYALFQKAVVEPAFPYQDLETVFVIAD